MAGLAECAGEQDGISQVKLERCLDEPYGLDGICQVSGIARKLISELELMGLAR